MERLLFYLNFKNSYGSDRPCCELDNKLHIVGLDLRLVSGFVSHDLAAFIAAVNYDIAFLGVGKRSYRTENTSAIVLAISGIDVNVKRAEAKRAVIARGVSEWKNLTAAILAYKSIIVFRESFVFHISPYFPTQNLAKISLTTSSETARPSSSAIAPSARSTSDDATSCISPIS